jgi:hypothetical protein
VPRAAGTMALTPAGPGVGAGAGSDPAARRSRRLVGWLVAFILARPPSPRPGHGHRRGGARRGGRLVVVGPAARRPAGLPGGPRRAAPRGAGHPAAGRARPPGCSWCWKRLLSSDLTLEIGVTVVCAGSGGVGGRAGAGRAGWLAGGAFVSGSLALVVWFLPQLLFGNGLLPEAWLRPQPGRLAHPPLDADQPVTAPRCFSLTRSFRLTIATGARPFRAGRDALPSPACDQPKPS